MLKCLKRILILAYFQTSLLMSKTTHCKHCKTIQMFNAIRLIWTKPLDLLSFCFINMKARIVCDNLKCLIH